MYRSNRKRRSDRAFHPKGYPNRPIDKLRSAEYKIDDASDAINTVKLLLGKEKGLESIKEAVETVSKILDSARWEFPRIDKCSFCEDEACTDTFAVAACPVHRIAFIDGKLGKDACISLEEHRIIEDMRKFYEKYDSKFRTEIFYPDQRPKTYPKGKMRKGAP